MSVVSAGRGAVEVSVSPAACEVRWRVATAAITAQTVHAWLSQRNHTKDKPADVTLVCAVSELGETGNRASGATFRIEAGGDSLVVMKSDRATVTRDAAVTHIDVFDQASGSRLLAATIANGNPPRLLYAVTNIWAALGVAGGRYEPVGASTR